MSDAERSGFLASPGVLRLRWSSAAEAGKKRLALSGFLAGYSAMTREAYTLDLRMFTAWCHAWQLRLFDVRGPTSSALTGRYS